MLKSNWTMTLLSTFHRCEHRFWVTNATAILSRRPMNFKRWIYKLTYTSNELIERFETQFEWPCLKETDKSLVTRLVRMKKMHSLIEQAKLWVATIWRTFFCHSSVLSISQAAFSILYTQLSIEFECSRNEWVVALHILKFEDLS